MLGVPIESLLAILVPRWSLAVGASRGLFELASRGVTVSSLEIRAGFVANCAPGAADRAGYRAIASAGQALIVHPMQARFQARTTWTILFLIAFSSLVLGAIVGCASQSGTSSTQVADRSIAGQDGSSSGSGQTDPPAAPARVAQPITIEWVGDMALSTELGLPPDGVDGALAPLRRPAARRRPHARATSRGRCRSAAPRNAAAVTPAPASRSRRRRRTPPSTARSDSTSSTRPTTTRSTTAPRATRRRWPH